MADGPTSAAAEALRTRVDELLAEMTTAEKAGQLTQYFYFGSLQETDAEPSVGGLPSRAETVEAALGRGEAGSLLFVTDPAEINRLQRLAIDGHRLGIPVLFGYDVIHGLRTILPVPIALAASWDPETIAQGQFVYAPSINHNKHRFGRVIDSRADEALRERLRA